MRGLVVDGALSGPRLLDACAGTGALELALRSSPPFARLDLLRPLARFTGFLLCRFEGWLATPLVEVACLASEAEWSEGALLDLRGALLSPLLQRVGPARARRLLAQGPLVAPSDVLLPWRGRAGRSAVSLSLVSALVAPGVRSGRAALAHERAAFASALERGDLAEGLRAFRERRPARFDW